MKSPSKETLLKMMLFGSTQKSVGSGTHTEDAKRLAAPFEWKEAVCYAFCKGCGVTLEINKKCADEYLKKLNLPPYKSSLVGYYFRVGRCSACDSKSDLVERLPLQKN